MKKNGFVMAETIFVIAVLSASLIAIYFTFTSVIKNQKQRTYYDGPEYSYRTYYILQFLKDDLKAFNYDTNKLNEIKCDSIFSGGSDKREICDQMMIDSNREANLDVKRIFISGYNVNINGLTDAQMSEDRLVNYLKTLTNIKEKKDSNDNLFNYRIIIEYKNERDGSTYYSSLGFIL